MIKTRNNTNMNMYKNYRSFAVLLLLSGINSMALGQNTNTATPDAEMIPGTTTGASLSSIYSPSLFDGSANVNVPIYEFTRDGGDYSVFMNFNTKGIRVDEPSSIIGQHWNLNAGATITRIVKDMPDELIGTYATPFNPTGHQEVDNEETYIRGKLITYTETQQQQNQPNVYRDGENDEFIVSLGGQNFSFYIGPNNQIYTVPHRNIKIEIFIDNQPASFVPGATFGPLGTTFGGTNQIQFRITDEDGTQYYFAPGDYETMPIDGFADWQQNQNTENCFPASKWVISKVTLANGDKINYTYDFYYDPYNMFYYKEYNNYLYEENWSASPVEYNFAGISASAMGRSRSEISQIAYPNGVILDFAYDASKRTEYGIPFLNEIKISSGDNCVRYQLYRDSIYTRYFLNRITLSSCDETYGEKYFSFEYNPLRLPRRLNSAQDFFGYYNGDSLVTYMVPKHGSTSAYGNNRSYSAYFAQAGNLSKVKNAYGGELNFYYSGNVAADQMSGIYPTDVNFLGKTAIDGVRVDSIVTKDKYHEGNNLTTSFAYSGGQLFLQGGYFHYPEYIDSASNVWKKVMFQSMFLTAHDLVNGSNHGYTKVIVRTFADNILLSRKDITFTNMKDATSANLPRYYNVPGSKNYFDYPYTDKQYLKSWEMGLPLTITEYDANNLLVKSTVNKYNFSPVDNSASGFLMNVRTSKVNSGTEGRYGGRTNATDWYPYKKVFTDTYYPFSGTAQLLYTITKQYSANSIYLTDTVAYEYDNYNNIKTVVTSNSARTKTATRLIYNYNVDGPGLLVPNPGSDLYKMTADGLEKVVSVETWKLGTGSTQFFNDLLLDGQITGYQYSDGKLWRKSTLNTTIGNPMGFTAYTGIPQGATPLRTYWNIRDAYNTTTPVENFRRTGTALLFDAKGNPLETQLLDQKRYDARVWDTATGQKLAEAANCRFSDIAYTSFESSLYGSNLSLSSAWYVYPGISGSKSASLWTPQNPGTAITVNGTQNLQAGKKYILSFWIKGPAPSAYIGTTAIPLGTPVYTNGVWKQYILRFTPATAAKIRITGSATLSYIDEIRLCPVGTQMQSWTYAPLFGLSSVTSASGRITYFEYDKLGRKNIIRDQEGNILKKTTYNIQ